MLLQVMYYITFFLRDKTSNRKKTRVMKNGVCCVLVPFYLFLNRKMFWL